MLVIIAVSCSNLLLNPLIDPTLDDIRPGSDDDVIISEDRIVTSITSGTTSSQQTVDVYLIFSSDISSLAESQLQLTNSVLSNFGGSGDSWHFTLTSQSRGWSGCVLPAGSVTKEDGRTQDELSFSYDYQPSVLSLLISSSAGSITSTSPIPLSFTFSEAVTGFEATDITVTNGTLSNFSGTGTSYSAEITPAGSGTIDVVVPPDAANAGGQGNSAASLAITYSNTVPTASLSGAVGEGGTAGYTTVIFTLNFSEPVTGLEISDFTLTNVILASLSGSGSQYEFAATPTDVNSGCSISIGLMADSVQNTAGLANAADTLINYTYDPGRVAANFSSALFPAGSSTVTNAGTVPVTLSFDLDMDYNHVENNEIFLNGSPFGGTLNGGPAIYTFDVTPPAEGTVTLSIADAIGQNDNVAGKVNMAATWSFVYDSISPASPAFTLEEFTSAAAVNSNDFVDDILVLSADLAALRSADTGSELTFEYTLDNGTNWLPFSGSAYIVSDGLYSGINIRSTDQAGNPAAYGTAVTDVTIDTVAPDSPMLTLGDSAINLAERNAFSIELSNGEPGIAFDWSIADQDGGTSNLTGSGVLDGSGYSSVSGIDLSSLTDGTLSVKAWLTDDAGNQSGQAQATAVLDTVVPATPVVLIETPPDLPSIPDPDPWTSVGDANRGFAFDVTGAEAGTAFSYVISTDGGAATLTGSGTVPAGGAVSFSPIDLRTLEDGNLTVSVTLADSVGNVSTAGTDTTVLKATVVNSPDFAVTVDTTNHTAYSFDITGEVNATYTYTIVSTTSGSTASGGSFGGTNTVTLGPFDFSPAGLDLKDGYLILNLSVTDIYGNNKTVQTSVPKDTLPVNTGTADFSGAPSAVNFDPSLKGDRQAIYGEIAVKYDTDTVIGSPYDDVFSFTDLQPGQSYTVSGGGAVGYDTIDLSAYTSDEAVIYTGINFLANDGVTPLQYTNDDSTGTVGYPYDDFNSSYPTDNPNPGINSGRIYIDMDGDGVLEVGTDDAVIDFDGFTEFTFSGNAFDGTPHSYSIDTAGISMTRVQGKYVETQTTTTYRPVLIGFNGSLGSSFTITGDVLAYDTSTGYNNSNMNGVIVFDFADYNNFKLATMAVAVNKWQFGIIQGGSLTNNLAYYSTTLNPDIVSTIQVKATGTPGQTELWAGGTLKTSYDYSTTYSSTLPLNDGRFGFTTKAAHGSIYFDMQPSNWAPYVKNYSSTVSQISGAKPIFDVVGDAFDFESDPVVITAAGAASKGTLTDNGDGTVTYTPTPGQYGLDVAIVTVSDGVNTNTSTIRIDLIP